MKISHFLAASFLAMICVLLLKNYGIITMGYDMMVVLFITLPITIYYSQQKKKSKSE